MRKWRLPSLNNKGDTIVEVLLAIAVVGAAMSAAFVSANQSLNGTRLSQERTEAIKIAQGQVDSLYAAAKDPSKSSAVFNSGMSSFYFNVSGGDPLQPIPGSTTYGPTGDTNRYTLRIIRNPSNPNEFKSLVTWKSSGFQTNAEAYIRYRVYK